MVQDSNTSPGALGIAAVERFTGLTKDTLRIWERRYGFPTPGRDANGERIYSTDQIERLRAIKRLLDVGHRPGKLMAMPLDALADLAAAPPAPAPEGEAAEFLAVLRAHDAERLHAVLTELLMRGGMGNFVMRVMPQLNEAVGNAWMRGELAIFEEHLYSHHAQSVLRTAITQMRPSGEGVRVLLTSLPDEPHTLGLLMAEALFSIEGAFCIALGSETPAPEVAQAAIAHRADIVALSFSAAFPAGTLYDALAELRGLLPETIELWAGGGGAMRPRKLPEGIIRAADFDEAATLLRERLGVRREQAAVGRHDD